MLEPAAQRENWEARVGKAKKGDCHGNQGHFSPNVVCLLEASPSYTTPAINTMVPMEEARECFRCVLRSVC